VVRLPGRSWTVRLVALLSALVVIASAGCVGASHASQPSTTVGPSKPFAFAAGADGVSLRLPAGWQAKALLGRLQIRNATRGRWGAPSAGQVWAVLDERSRSFAASDGLSYPSLVGRLTIAPGQFSTHQLAGGDWGAARLFRQHGRYFELGVVYGDTHPSQTLVRRLDRVLATLVIRPTSLAPATLQPPRFLATTGWRSGSNLPAPAQPQGDQLCAWASMIPYHDSNVCPIPGRTIRALKPGQMVISVDAYRDWTQPLRPRLPHHLVVPSTLTTQAEGGYQSATIIGHTPQYSLQIDVYVGHNQPFTTAMRAQAQHELDRLHLPRWPAPAR
jgi:hypothetical protein